MGWRDVTLKYIVSASTTYLAYLLLPPTAPSAGVGIGENWGDVTLKHIVSASTTHLLLPPTAPSGVKNELWGGITPKFVETLLPT